MPQMLFQRSKFKKFFGLAFPITLVDEEIRTAVDNILFQNFI